MSRARSFSCARRLHSLAGVPAAAASPRIITKAWGRKHGFYANHGRSCPDGRRALYPEPSIPVATVVEMVADGMTPEEILKASPILRPPIFEKPFASPPKPFESANSHCSRTHEVPDRQPAVPGSCRISVDPWARRCSCPGVDDASGPRSGCLPSGPGRGSGSGLSRYRLRCSSDSWTPHPTITDSL